MAHDQTRAEPQRTSDLGPRTRRVVVTGCLLTLMLTCFGRVLLRDHQFSCRDVIEYYYPLYQRVQQEWEAGRWPLWEPEENGGMPLLGNPTAAVLYPGKVLYFVLPYAWAARLYVIAHVLVAFAGLRVLLRAWQVSGTGSSLGALAYAFGAPVLSQYCNPIFLVGAAWIPWGLWSVDRWVRLKKRRAVVELAVVLALQALGGDPEAAYLVVLCGAVYALILGGSVYREGNGASRADRIRGNRAWIGLGLGTATLVWVGCTLGTARWIKSHRAWFPFEEHGPYPTWYQFVLIAGWILIAVVVWRRLRHRSEVRAAGRSLVVLAGSAALALGLGAAQLVPVFEFSRLSTRAAENSTYEFYYFSVEPYRALEGIWPGFFGLSDHPEGNWLRLIPPRHVVKLWVPSLYLGGLSLVLALGAAGFRDGPPWRIGLTVIGLASLLAALGQFSSPVWWARAVPGLEADLGAHDPEMTRSARVDGGVTDGAGSFYWLLAALLPGFESFRYPGKMLSLTALALSALAGIGWDRARQGRAIRSLPVILVLSLGALTAVIAARDPLVRLLGRPYMTSIFGPFQAPAAVHAMLRALGQGTVVMIASMLLLAAARRRSRWAEPAALIVLTADLAVAHASLVQTVPQTVLDQKPKLVRLIEAAARRDPGFGPFRVHRMPQWFPASWSTRGSAHRSLEMIQWQYDTIQPKFALLGRLAYTCAGGALELGDFVQFFRCFSVPLDLTRAPLRDAVDGQQVLYHTRRGFDLWNTRYFVLPRDPAGWQGFSRGIAAFLTDQELLAPEPGLLEDPQRYLELEAWTREQDWVLLRNQAAYPRSWVVHRARFLKPIRLGDRAERRRIMKQILYPANDPLWFEPGRPAFDPHTLAWIETDDPTALTSYSPGTGADPEEAVAITRYEPQRVEIEARLRRPGIVILADVDYPGWTLTRDGQPAPILRANRLMRGAAVGAGTHRLVYTYRPLSFRVGSVLSLVSLGIGLVLIVVPGRWCVGGGGGAAARAEVGGSSAWAVPHEPPGPESADNEQPTGDNEPGISGG